ncbi:MAG: electron transport complex subunit E [Oscillospiraceae bacterium]|nr:electron transport complex subunit E [Oscillospiraceae bacterium]
MKKTQLIKNGLFDENPVLRLVIGTCPTLAISTTVLGGFGMGLAATFVLICSNAVISALRRLIPDKVRIPAYITVIASFVTILQMLVKAFVPALDGMLGIYLPLIVVNCIILGRAEMFASKNPVLDSAVDGLGMGLGFTLALIVMASIREIIGSGTWLGLRLIPEGYGISIMTTPPGGFFTFGIVMALLTALLSKRGKKCASGAGCEGCAARESCGEVK